MRWIVRKLAGVWLALGMLSLSACFTSPTPSAYKSYSSPSPGSTTSASLSSGSSASSSATLPNDAPVDQARSQSLTDYLHNRRLPLVGGRVLAGNGGPRQVILYGFVATPFGKIDAADQARVFLNDPEAQIDNRIKVTPELANGAGNAPPATAGPQNENDVQAYQDQQALARQQLQQYQNQGPGIVTTMPLMGMFGPFGSFGSGGSGYSFGTSPFGYGPGFGPGYYGPGYGGYSPYPPSGFGSPFPYRPFFP